MDENMIKATAEAAEIQRKRNHTRASNKHIASHYDRISVILRKGIKDRIAEFTDESMNAYINRLIAEDLERHEKERASD